MTEPGEAGWIDVSAGRQARHAHWPDNPPIVMQRSMDLERGHVCNLSHLAMGVHSGAAATIRASVAGTGDATSDGVVPFQSLRANQRAGLLLANGTVYVAFGSHGDVDPYHGWVFAYNAATLAQTAVFNTTPNAAHGGVWQTGAPPATADGTNIFMVTGNGSFDANSGASPNTDYGETLLRLQVNAGAGNFSVIDSFTPSNQLSLNSSQIDLGAAGALLLPDAAGSVAHPHLAIVGGGTRVLYVVNRDNLGRFTLGGPNAVLQTLTMPQQLFGTPAYYAGTNAVYTAAAYDTLKAFTLTAGSVGSTPSSHTVASFPFPGASPAITSNGASVGIVWLLDTSGFGNTPLASPAVLHAFDAGNLATELYNSSTNSADAAGNAVKFAVPTVANGKAFVGTQTELSVYGLQ